MSVKDLQTRAEAWLKARMERLTPRQRLGLVTVLLLVYAAVCPDDSVRWNAESGDVDSRRRTPPAATTAGKEPVTSKHE